MPRMTGSRAADYTMTETDELSRIRRALELILGQTVSSYNAREDEAGDDED